MAEKRWGHDQKTLAFEADVIVELSSRNGAVALGDWMHSIGLHMDVKPEEFSLPFENVHIRESHHQRKVLARVWWSNKNRQPDRLLKTEMA